MKNVAVFICVLASVCIAFASEEDKSAPQSVKVKDKTSEKDAVSEKPPSSEKNTLKNETRFKVGGILETGVDVISKVNRANKEDAREIRSVARGEIEISARPLKEVRAEIGIEYDRRDTQSITVDKFFAQYNISNNSQIRAGIMKKAFGLEERAGLDERYFRSRSIINDGLEADGFLEHDLTLQYRRGVGARWRLTGGVSLSESPRNSYTEATDTVRCFQNYSAQYNRGNIEVIGAAVIQHFHVVPREWYTTAFASSVSCKRSTPTWASEAELTFGTSMNERVINNNNVFILGARKQERFFINTGLKTFRQIIPVAEAAFYWDNLQNEKNFETQIRGGLTLGFTKSGALQFRNTYGAILRTSDGETDVRRYRFDSEVVVIF